MFDSVETAIGLSLRYNKPLLVVLSTAAASSSSSDIGDNDWATSLATRVLKTQGNFGTIPLTVKQGTTDFANFVSVFPAVKAPAIYVILKTAFLLKIEEPVSPEELVDQLKQLELDVSTNSSSNTNNPSPALGSTTSHTSTVAGYGSPYSSLPASLPTPTDPSSNHSLSTSSSSSLSSTANANANANANSRTPRPVGNHDNASSSSGSGPTNSGNSNSSGTTLPSGAAVVSHQSEVRKMKREAQEERKRILRLMQNDREERKARDLRRASMKADRPKAPLDPNDTPKEGKDEAVGSSNSNSNKDKAKAKNATNCALLIRLFDGTALKHTFESTAPLKVVREWVDQNRSDSEEPFTFYQNIPQRWFQATDEEKPLKELGLCPSAALILKPVHNVANAYHRPSLSSYITMDKVANAVYTFLGIGFVPQPREEDSEDEEYKTSSSTPVPRASSSSLSAGESGVELDRVNESLRMRSARAPQPGQQQASQPQEQSDNVEHSKLTQDVL